MFDPETGTATGPGGRPNEFFGPAEKEKKKGFLPGFEVAALAAAIGVAVVLLRRRD